MAGAVRGRCLHNAQYETPNGQVFLNSDLWGDKAVSFALGGPLGPIGMAALERSDFAVRRLPLIFAWK